MINFDSYIPSPKAEFCNKLKDICLKLAINPEWLLAVMWIESRINPKAVNQQSGATGLIQFMPSTASTLGTTTAELKKMDAVQQLEYVYKYLKPYADKMKSFVDVYFAVFFPAAIDKSLDYVLQTSKLSAALIAKQNPGYDINKDSKITVGEVELKLYALLGIESVQKKKNNLLLIAGAALITYLIIK